MKKSIDEKMHFTDKIIIFLKGIFMKQFSSYNKNLLSKNGYLNHSLSYLFNTKNDLSFDLKCGSLQDDADNLFLDKINIKNDFDKAMQIYFTKKK